MSTHGELAYAPYAGLTDQQLRTAELEAQVAQLRQELRRIEATTRRSAVGAHDIRNALTVILAETEFLASSLREPDQQESVRSLASAARIVASIAQEILVSARKSEWRGDGRQERRPGTASRVRQRAVDRTASEASPIEVSPIEVGATKVGATEVGAIEVDAIEVDAGELMTGCRKLIERMLEHSSECVFAADPDLWPVTVQPRRFEAALLNLVSNARDAMPAGGRAAIRVRNLPQGSALPCGLPAGQYVVFSVEDTGTGMPPEVLAKATEAFFTTKPRDRGTGLGLAMVHAFATEAGGALHIQSEVGRGTRVEVLLPRTRSRPQPLDAADSRFALLQRIHRRVRTPWLLEVLDAWSQVPEPGALPQPAQLEAALLDHSACSLVIAVDHVTEPIELRLVRMGQELVELLEEAAIEQVALAGPELSGSLATTYRQALRSRCPNYQFARYRLGQDSDIRFERLVLPAAIDTKTASHLFGVVLITSDEGGGHEL